MFAEADLEAKNADGFFGKMFGGGTDKLEAAAEKYSRAANVGACALLAAQLANSGAGLHAGVQGYQKLGCGRWCLQKSRNAIR